MAPDSQRRRILLIYPSNSGLPSAEEEVSQIASMHNVEVVSGSVSEKDIRQALRLSPTWDLIWFCTHSHWSQDLQESYIQLNPGTVLDQETTVALVRSSGADLAVINTCESILLGLLIVDQTNCDVICTISSIPDKQAARTGVLLARALQSNRSYRDAYRIARPGTNKVYAYLPSLNAIDNPLPPISLPASPGATEAYKLISTQIEDIKTDLSILRSEFERRLILSSSHTPNNTLPLILATLSGMLIFYLASMLQRGAP